MKFARNRKVNSRRDQQNIFFIQTVGRSCLSKGYPSTRATFLFKVLPRYSLRIITAHNFTSDKRVRTNKMTPL